MSVDRNIVGRWTNVETLDISYELIEAEWRIYASLNWVIIGSDNGLSPVRRQAIIWTNAGILLIGPLGTSFSEILIGVQTFSFKKLNLKTASAKWRLFCLGLNEWRKYWQHPVRDNQCLERADHHISSLSSSVEPASNDFGCICEQSWKDQCSMEVYITINRTKSYCSKLLIKLVITTKNFFFLHSLYYLSELLSLVTCKQRADHFTPMMWFDFIRWRFHFTRRLFHYSN